MPLIPERPIDAPVTPADVISWIVASLRESKQTDLELLDVLVSRILLAKPTPNAINDAAADIERLASLRAQDTAHDPSNKT